jgi:hypothetical protein
LWFGIVYISLLLKWYWKSLKSIITSGAEVLPWCGEPLLIRAVIDNILSDESLTLFSLCAKTNSLVIWIIICEIKLALCIILHRKK